MAEINKEKTKGEEEVKKNNVRITLSCRNVKNVERVCSEIINKAKSKEDVQVVGPIRLPTKILTITTRRSPIGQGSKTWDKFELKIYKRVINLVCTSSDIKEITSIKIDPGVDVELIMTDSE